jgi:predicted ATPase/transcriptional regulator with XRE-family HTH domain/Tfp pilus assembly protein PilF
MTNDVTEMSAAFGRWIKRLRAHHDLTQEQLAELAYCSVQAIRAFETGKRRPSLEMAERLAEVLRVPAEQQEEFIRLARRVAVDDPGEHAPLPVVATGAAPPPAAPTPTPPSVRLPSPPTALVGRQAERTVLQQLIQSGRRLVTVVGPGGVGKTRLAIQVAHDLAGEFAHGVFFVDLGSVTMPGDIPTALIQAVESSLSGASDPAAQLMALLSHCRMLLVLDNFEQLLAVDGGVEATTLIDQLVQSADGLHLLITSRERLRMPGEHVFELTGLAVPSPFASEPSESDAVTLFLERARQMVHGFTLTADEQAAVARICTLLDGIPLGIELAAAWVRTLTVTEIAQEVVRSIDFLTLTQRGAPGRHRSLRAVFEYSWRLLSEDERRVLARLALFRGGFDRNAAQEVAGANLPLLAALIDKSMLRSNTTGDTAVRYDLHELLRQYLSEKLQEASEETTVLRRHAEYFTAVAERVSPQLYAPDAQKWQHQLEAEQGNLRAALHWSLREVGDAELGLRLASALGRLWYLVGRWKEGREWLELARIQPVDGGAARARLLVTLGELSSLLGDQKQAEQALLEGLERWRTLGDAANIAWARFQLGNLYTTRGDYALAEAQFEESLDLYRQIGERWGMATVLNQLGSVAISQNDYRQAAVWLAESVPILRSLNRQGGIAVTLNLLGRARLGEGEIEQAIQFFYEALEIAKERRNQAGMAWSHINLGLAYLAADEPRQAANHFQAALALYQELDSLSGMMAVFAGLAAVTVAEERWQSAVQLLAVVERLQTQSGHVLTSYENEIVARTKTRTQAALDETTWCEAWKKGSVLKLEAAIAVAKVVG